jgi:hypothetical protein
VLWLNHAGTGFAETADRGRFACAGGSVSCRAAPTLPNLHSLMRWLASNVRAAEAVQPRKRGQETKARRASRAFVLFDDIA